VGLRIRLSRRRSVVKVARRSSHEIARKAPTRRRIPILVHVKTTVHIGQTALTRRLQSRQAFVPTRPRFIRLARKNLEPPGRDR
jgi:hypothetical protein